MEIPPSIRTPDATWLSEVLGTAITSLDARVIGADRGFLSTTWQLTLSSDPPGRCPRSLVLKSESSNPIFQSVGRERRSFDREIRFYRELAPRLSAQLPRLYACGSGDDDCWLLMEDLSHQRPGDQVRGLSHGEVEVVVRRIAAVHAQFWNDAALRHCDWLPAHRYWFSDPDLSQLDPLVHEYGRRIGEPMVRLLRATMEQMPQIDAAIAERPFSLVHGDLRADNLMFDGPSDAPSVSLLDWQTVTRSLPAIDLAYLFGGSEPEIERAGHVDELLSLWHGELLSRGVSDYPLEMARRDLQLAALRCLSGCVRLYAMLHHPSTSVRSALFRDEAIERHISAARELEAWEALPQPLAGF